MRHYFSLPSFSLPSFPFSIPASPVPPTGLLKQSGDTTQGLVPRNPSSHAPRNQDNHLFKHIHLPAATMMHTVIMNQRGLQMPLLDHIRIWNEHTKDWQDRCEYWDGYSTSDISHPGVLSRFDWIKFNTIRLEIPILPPDEFFKTAIAIAKDAKSREEYKRMFEEKNALLRRELEKMAHVSCMDLMRYRKFDVQDSQSDLAGEFIDEQTNGIPNNYLGIDKTQYLIHHHYDGPMGPEDWLKDNGFLPASEQRSQFQRKRKEMNDNYDDERGSKRQRTQSPTADSSSPLASSSFAENVQEERAANGSKRKRTESPAADSSLPHTSSSYTKNDQEERAANGSKRQRLESHRTDPSLSHASFSKNDQKERAVNGFKQQRPESPIADSSSSHTSSFTKLDRKERAAKRPKRPKSQTGSSNTRAPRRSKRIQSLESKRTT
ncbi:hypothetical protein M441DRAFT_54975 [Trichoderma asperellum CBS 433.97]|uniref:Uncharacterized protein n=1 Tax=Trichoderma asperellum (strain ATCC 204424 / CBS 433.97 / NBRC 101777) TaxID=1042311 RepID=A0A2T3ZG90_TRIA4|nr:hypothetical protein M441DRAFT_54975 [Trichoderma asperellum CBS 433.97]PTB43831.1 hypothetical protein M441DRAFT_54975 [Trichoderma asperellum CBS 433.97]